MTLRTSTLRDEATAYINKHGKIHKNRTCEVTWPQHAKRGLITATHLGELIDKLTRKMRKHRKGK